MRDEKTLSSAFRVFDNHIPEHIVWERLENEASRRLFRELKPGKYYTIKLERRVERDLVSNYAVLGKRAGDQVLDYRIDIGLNQVEQQKVRMYTVEDMPQTALMKTAIQEVKSRLRRWARAWWKEQTKAYAPWTWA